MKEIGAKGSRCVTRLLERPAALHGSSRADADAAFIETCRKDKKEERKRKLPHKKGRTE